MLFFWLYFNIFVLLSFCVLYAYCSFSVSFGFPCCNCFEILYCLLLIQSIENWHKWLETNWQACVFSRRDGFICVIQNLHLRECCITIIKTSLLERLGCRFDKSNALSFNFVICHSEFRPLLSPVSYIPVANRIIHLRLAGELHCSCHERVTE